MNNKLSTPKNPAMEDMFQEFMNTMTSTPRKEGVRGVLDDQEIDTSSLTYTPDEPELNEEQSIEMELAKLKEQSSQEDPIRKLASLKSSPKTPSKKLEQPMESPSLNLESNEDVIRKLASMQVEQSNPSEESFENKLSAAQKQQDNMRMANAFIQGFGQIASGAIGSGAQVKPQAIDLAPYTQNVKDLQSAKEKDIEMKFQQGFNDPTSAISTAARVKLQKAFPQFADNPDFKNISAAQALKLGVKLTGDEEGLTAYQKEILKLQNRQIESGERKFAESQSRLKDEKQTARSVNFVEKFNANPSIKKIDEQVTAAINARALLDVNNPVTGEAAKTAIARLSGEVGALSDTDRASFGGSKAIADKLKQVAETAATGRMTDENRAYLKEITDTFEKTLTQRKTDIAKRMSEQYSKPMNVDSKTLFENAVPGVELPSERSTASSENKQKPSWAK